MVTHVRDGNYSQMDLGNASARQLSDVPGFPHYNISPKLFLLRKYIKYIYIGVCIYMCVHTHTHIYVSLYPAFLTVLNMNRC